MNSKLYVCFGYTWPGGEGVVEGYLDLPYIFLALPLLSIKVSFLALSKLYTIGMQGIY